MPCTDFIDQLLKCEFSLANILVPGQVVLSAMATYHIEFDELDLGQLLDGLEMRSESWERTAEYLRSGYIEGGFVVEECSNPEEADGIAAHYRKIIADIRGQMEEQS